MARKVLDPLKLPDPLDLWGDKAAAAQKSAEEAAAAQTKALQDSQSSQPTLAGADVEAARLAEQQRKLALAGQSSTILTGSGGLGTTGTTGGKTLLGA